MNKKMAINIFALFDVLNLKFWFPSIFILILYSFSLIYMINT
jgi:hypothetical protein